MQIAAVAATTTERLQHLLTDADWDPLALDEARVRRLVTVSPRDGILVLDDTGLPKQGRAPAGVARQYSGRYYELALQGVLASQPRWAALVSTCNRWQEETQGDAG